MLLLSYEDIYCFKSVIWNKSHYLYSWIRTFAHDLFHKAKLLFRIIINNTLKKV